MVKNKENDCTLKWVTSKKGDIADGAIQGGFNKQKKPLYICKVSDGNKK